MVLECGDSFGMGVDAMFASATEHVIDIFLDIIAKVAASKAASINTVVNFVRWWRVGVHSWANFASWYCCPVETAFKEDLTAFQSTSLNVSSVQSLGMNLSHFLESLIMC